MTANCEDVGSDSDDFDAKLLSSEALRNLIAQRPLEHHFRVLYYQKASLQSAFKRFGEIDDLMLLFAER